LKVKDVIVAIDNYPIRKDPDLNYLMAYKYSPGDVITITVIRDGKTVEIKLTLAVRP
jgi:S1-C subfamily serine protease